MFRRPQDGNYISVEPMFFNTNDAKRPTILIFDSGVGGLSIYDEVRKMLPNAYYLYVFDNDAFPYGEKPERFIIDRIIVIISAMLRRHMIDLVIIACNTASTISLPALRERFPCPIIGVVPAIKPATRLTRNGIVGLLATGATVRCGYTDNLINKYARFCQILKLGGAELVNMAEAKLHGELVQLSVLRKLLRPLLRTTQQPDTIVLGCTHFPLLSQEIQTILPEGVCLVDSGLAIARRAVWLVKRDINTSKLRGEFGPNKAYCLATTSQVAALLPTLIRYGFGSLEILTLH